MQKTAITRVPDKLLIGHFEELSFIKGCAFEDLRLAEKDSNPL